MNAKSQLPITNYQLPKDNDCSYRWRCSYQILRSLVCKLQTTNYQLPTTRYQLSTVGHQSSTPPRSNYSLSTIDYQPSTPHGYIALITVLILGAVGVVIATSLLTIGIIRSQGAISTEKEKKIRYSADSCVEEALRQIRLSTPYAGTASGTYNGISCTYTVANNGGQARTITSEAVNDGITRKVKVIVASITPNIAITSWEELANF